MPGLWVKTFCAVDDAGGGWGRCKVVSAAPAFGIREEEGRVVMRYPFEIEWLPISGRWLALAWLPWWRAPRAATGRTRLQAVWRLCGAVLRWRCGGR